MSYIIEDLKDELIVKISKILPSIFNYVFLIPTTKKSKVYNISTYRAPKKQGGFS